MKLSGWGRYPVIEARIHFPRSFTELTEIIASNSNVIARGNGRAYGDSAINSVATIDMRNFNRMLQFDETSGQLIVEAGVLLGDVIEAFLNRGWFPSVTPGTKFVTIGGAVAADVHGKNHHKEGSFRSCVDWIEVIGVDGTITKCSRTVNAELFDFTLGGMGLTGIILRVAIRLRKIETSWIKETVYAKPDLKSVMMAFEDAQDATYSVAWIDCLQTGKNLGRSLIMLGDHATANDLENYEVGQTFHHNFKRKVSIPTDVPAFFLNSISLRIFNLLYYWLGKRKSGLKLVSWDSYFYPLDTILNWNRIYGRQGFSQFQCVFPLEKSEAGLKELLAFISQSKSGSFLAVLKRFGKQESPFSFPMEGYTLALDFPVSKKNTEILKRLDEITLSYGGRFYLAKDSRMSLETFQESDKRITAFRNYRIQEQMMGKYRSVQSERLEL